MTGTTPATCRACGAAVGGKFCSECGTPVGPVLCAGCGAELSPGAKFCHRCGTAVAAGAAPSSRAPAPGAPPSRGEWVPLPATDRTPWIGAGLVILVALGAIVWHLVRGEPAPAGGAAAGSGPAGLTSPSLSGPAPDISQMTPRERFDRLFNRVMAAAEIGDTAEVERFLPMARMAYDQLPAIDPDARYFGAALSERSLVTPE